MTKLKAQRPLIAFFITIIGISILISIQPLKIGSIKPNNPSSALNINNSFNDNIEFSQNLELIVNYITKCQQEDGGFSKNIQDNQSFIGNTYYAVNSLYFLDYVDLVDKNSCIDFIISNQDSDGGFKEPGGTSTSLLTTSEALTTLYIINGMNYIKNFSGLINFLNDSQAMDGIFKENPTSSSWSIPFILAGLSSLLLINRLDLLKNGTYLTEFILSCYQNGGFSSTNTSTTFTLVSTASGLISLEFLNKLEQINETEVMENVLQTIKADGGFNNNSLQTFGNLLDTLAALIILESIGNVSKIDILNTSTFINNCLNSDGSFSFSPNGSITSDLSWSYAAISLNRIIESEFYFEELPTLNYFTQNFNGTAFSNDKDKNISLDASYHALLCLRFFPVSEDINISAVINYILGFQGPNGGFKDSDGNESLIETYWSVKSIYAMNCSQLINKSRLIGFLLNLNRTDGGFSNFISVSTTNLSSTYLALSVLNSLGALHLMDLNLTYNYLLSCQNEDGKFSNFPSSSSSALKYTYYGILSLRILHELLNFNKTAALEYFSSLKQPDGGFSHTTLVNSSLEATSFAVSSYFALAELDSLNKTAIRLYLKNLEIRDGVFLQQYLQNYTVSFRNTENDIETTMESLFRALEIINYINIPNMINFTGEFWNHFWDSTYGGFYAATNRSGSPQVLGKNVSHNLWALDGLIRMYDMTMNEYFFADYILPQVRFINKYLWDGTNGGFYHYTERNGTINDSIQHSRTKFSIYQFWGILSFLNLYEITKNNSHLILINDTVNFLLNHLWNDSSHYFYYSCNESGTDPETFKDSWTIAWGIFAFLKLYLFTNNQTYLNMSEEMMSEALLHPWNSTTKAFITRINETNDPIDPKRTTNIQALFLQDLFLLNNLTNNDTYANYGRELLNFTLSTLYDDENSLFFEAIDQNGQLIVSSFEFYTQCNMINTLQYLLQINESVAYLEKMLSLQNNLFSSFEDAEFGGIYSSIDANFEPELVTKEIIAQILGVTFTSEYDNSSKEFVFFFNFTKTIDIPIRASNLFQDLKRERITFLFKTYSNKVVSFQNGFQASLSKFHVSYNFSLLDEIGLYKTIFSYQEKRAGFELFNYFEKVIDFDYVYLNDERLWVNYGVNSFNLTRDLNLHLAVNSSEIVLINVTEHDSSNPVPSLFSPLAYFVIGSAQIEDFMHIEFDFSKTGFNSLEGLFGVKAYYWNGTHWLQISEQETDYEKGTIRFAINGSKEIAIFRIPEGYYDLITLILTIIIISLFSVISASVICLSFYMIQKYSINEKLPNKVRIKERLVNMMKELSSIEEETKLEERNKILEGNQKGK